MRSVTILFTAALASSAAADITLDNLQPGETVRYPVLALKGKAEGKSLSVGREGAKAQSVPLVGNRFATLVELKPGANMIVFKSGQDSMRIKVEYRPMTTPYQIKTVWVRASDEGEDYFLNRPGQKAQVREKLDVAMKLLQSVTAETMQAAGYGRKTFPLEFDKDGKVVVHFVASPKTGNEMRATDGNPSWSHIYDLLKPKFDESTTRWVTMVGWTGWDPATKRGTGHFALGGGALAAFGSGTMPHWPARLADVYPALMDSRVIDHEKEFEDSGNRRTVWANVSTAYGAMLHELGHALGLPHTADGLSVMSRGFDNFGRTLVVEEAPLPRRDEPLAFAPDQVVRWGGFFAARLNASPFFQPDAPPPSGEAPTVERNGDEIRLRARHGIRTWGAENDDTPAVWEEKKEAAPPTNLTLSLKDLRDRLKTTRPFRITVVDTLGQWHTIDVKD
ncbi:MAG: hypothetical protein ACO1SV_10600 [Fimbriimonas sp.]